MGLFGALFGSRKPDQHLVEHQVALAAQLDELSKRLAVLEGEMHPARLVEWHELAEKLRRYLARISAVEGRAAAREQAPAPDPVQAAVLRMKFPPKQNGG